VTGCDRASLAPFALSSLVLTALLAGCAGAPTHGYYQGDGPGGPPPVNLDRLADATPRLEPLNPGANTPYTALGRKYVPYTSLKAYRARGVATWYGRKFQGKRTSSGERYDMYAMTAAHTILPIPSYARVTNLANGKSVVVRINDRGPFHAERIIDLSYAAAYKLGYVNAGSAKVEVEAILPGKRAAAGEQPPV
jgi:rare lipoprotein A